jgi:long-chain acyl-CoA synthetase
MNKENATNNSGAPKKRTEQELSISNGDSLQGKYPKGLDWDITIPSTDLVSLVEETIKEYSDKPCIDFLGTKYTYKEVGELIDKAAEGFKKMGIGKNKRVGLFMPNTPL